jgi:uncharacterized protein YrrD
MQFKENAEVLTSTGDKVGRIDRVVIDPKSNEVTHLVVKKGILFTRDKVVPLDRVEAANGNEVVLKAGPTDPDGFPDFEETHYISIDQVEPYAKRGFGGVRPLAWYYPLPGGAWWRRRMGGYPGYPDPPYARRTELNIPEDTVSLEEGAKVVSSDDEDVGNVERVYVGEEEQRVTHLLISQGVISKVRRLIPSMWVENVLMDRVRLSISKDFVEDLPEYSTED